MGTTTPFDMTVMNESSRFDLVIRVLERVAEAKKEDPMAGQYAPLMKNSKPSSRSIPSMCGMLVRTCPKSKIGCGRLDLLEVCALLISFFFFSPFASLVKLGCRGQV